MLTRGAFVWPDWYTLDTIGTRSAIAQTIVAEDGDCLFALKINGSATHDGGVCFFAKPIDLPAGLGASGRLTPVDAIGEAAGQERSGLA